MVWIHGRPGTGKTLLAIAYARKVAGDDYFIHPPGSLKWWDGYEGQQVVILDDFRRRDLREAGGFSYLLRVLDRYDCDVEVKGGYRRAHWSTVIITAQRDPETEFTYRDGDNGDRVEEDLGQLVRRLAYAIELRVLDGLVQEVDRLGPLRAKYGTDGFTVLPRSGLLDVDVGVGIEPAGPGANVGGEQRDELGADLSWMDPVLE